MNDLLAELFDRRPMRAETQARIERLNPDPKPQFRLRGLWRKPLSWRRAKAQLRAGRELLSPFRGPDGRRHDPFYEGLRRARDIERCFGVRLN
jgi:hypothetical protein